jgi:uncharacterized membrane protein YfcA
MSAWVVVAALVLGLERILSGLFGVGGGSLFVPTLVLLGLGQVEAAATSLLAIMPTAAVGAWRRAWECQARAALVVGLASVAGAALGVQIATRIDESLLRRLFGVLLLAVAGQLAFRAVRQGRRYPDAS